MYGLLLGCCWRCIVLGSYVGCSCSLVVVGYGDVVVWLGGFSGFICW